jgi:hypothetical protein
LWLEKQAGIVYTIVEQMWKLQTKFKFKIQKRCIAEILPIQSSGQI